MIPDAPSGWASALAKIKKSARLGPAGAFGLAQAGSRGRLSLRGPCWLRLFNNRNARRFQATVNEKEEGSQPDEKHGATTHPQFVRPQRLDLLSWKEH